VRADSSAGPEENSPVQNSPEENSPEENSPEENSPEENSSVENGPDDNEEPAEQGPAARRTLPFYADLEALAPALLRSQNAWLAQIDSLAAPDRKTHELIRMVCSVIARNPQGVRHHAMLAAEVGATWEEVAGSVVLAEPAFGILVAVEAFPWARKGWERGSSLGDEEEPG
jgi:hypothetical protein